MMTNKRIVISMIVLATIAIFFIILRQQNTNEFGIKPLQVGVILNLTGGLAQADTPKKKVLETALEYLKREFGNSDPIHSMQLIFEDAKTDPKIGLAAFRKLYDRGIRTFITGTSFNAMSLLPLTEANKCLLFGVSGHPDFGKNGQYTFRIYPRVETGVSKMLHLLKAQANPRVYVLHTDEPFGTSYATELKSKYTNIIGVETFKITQSDFENSIAKIRNAQPDRLVVIGFGIGEKNLLKQMVERRVFIPVVGSEVFYYAATDLPNFSEVDGIQAFYKSTFFLGPALLDFILTNNGSNFVEFYREMNDGAPPQLFGVFAADALVLLRNAMMNCRSGDYSVENLHQELLKLDEIDGLSGHANLLKTRELEYELHYYRLDKSGHILPARDI